MSKDGICRVWSPTNSDETHVFYMRALVDPSQNLMTSQPQEHIQNTTSTISKLVNYPIHYISHIGIKNSIQIAIEGNDKQRYNFQKEMYSKLLKFRDLIKDTPDLLFQVQDDGSLTIWGIQVYIREFPFLKLK